LGLLGSFGFAIRSVKRQGAQSFGKLNKHVLKIALADKVVTTTSVNEPRLQKFNMRMLGRTPRFLGSKSFAPLLKESSYTTGRIGVFNMVTSRFAPLGPL
jgi:hypothetical protein